MYARKGQTLLFIQIKTCYSYLSAKDNGWSKSPGKASFDNSHPSKYWNVIRYIIISVSANSDDDQHCRVRRLVLLNSRMLWYGLTALVWPRCKQTHTHVKFIKLNWMEHYLLQQHRRKHMSRWRPQIWPLPADQVDQSDISHRQLDCRQTRTIGRRENSACAYTLEKYRT